jgi:hypothetical protein
VEVRLHLELLEEALGTQRPLQITISPPNEIGAHAAGLYTTYNRRVPPKPAALVLAALLAGCPKEAPPDASTSAAVAPSGAHSVSAKAVASSEADRVRGLVGGPSTSNDAVLMPNAFWRRHRVYKLVNYTMPHIPDCRVAVAPDGEVLVLAGAGDRVAVPDPVGNFNRAARSESLTIDDGNAERYLRFAIESYIASFMPAYFVATQAEADALAGAPRPAPSAQALPKLAVESRDGRHRLAFFYRDPAGFVRYVFTVAGDGSLEVESARYPDQGRKSASER